jgi:hypothetical protein
MKEMSSWITVADWMLDLELNARELMIFALVYGVCSHNERYYGTREHTAKWARCTADTAGVVLNALAEKGFLRKQEETNHGSIKRCYYTVDRKAVDDKLEGTAEEGAAGDAGTPPPEGAGKPVEKSVENPPAGGKIRPDDRENPARTGAKIQPATGAKIPDYINSNTSIKDTHKGQADSVFTGPHKKPETKEDVTALFNKARKRWNERDLKPECRDVIIPPSEYGCLRTFEHYGWEEIDNAIQNYDWHVKGRCGKGYKPPPPYGSIYGFLKNGVARYFDDDAIDQQFKEPKHGS